MADPHWAKDHKEVVVLVDDEEGESLSPREQSIVQIADENLEEMLYRDELNAYEPGIPEEKRDAAKRSICMPYWLLLRHYPSFRLLYFGNVISRLGDSLNYIAVVTVLGSITDSGLLLSALLITRMLPRILLSPLVGVLADRFDRRTQMLISDACRFFVVLGFLFVRSESTLWLLYVLSFLQFSFSALYEPSRSGLMPTLINLSDVTTANTLDGATWSTMTVLASAVGGFVTAVFGPYVDFCLDAVTYLCSILLVLPLLRHPVLNKYQKSRKASGRRREGSHAYDQFENVWVDIGGTYMGNSAWNGVLELNVEEDPCVEDHLHNEACEDDEIDDLSGGWHDSAACNQLGWEEGSYKKRKAPLSKSLPKSARAMLRHGDEGVSMFAVGLKFVGINRYVLAMILLKGTSQFIEGAVNTANIEFSQSVYDISDGSALLGALYSLMGIGTFLGPVLAKRFGKESHFGTHVVFSVAFFLLACGTLLLAIVDNVWLFLIVNTFRSSGTSICWVFATSMLQQICVDQYRGRTLAMDLGFSTLCQALGTLLTGALLQFGQSPYLCCLVAGTFAAIACVLWALYFIIKREHYSRAIRVP